MKFMHSPNQTAYNRLYCINSLTRHNRISAFQPAVFLTGIHYLLIVNIWQSYCPLCSHYQDHVCSHKLMTAGVFYSCHGGIILTWGGTVECIQKSLFWVSVEEQCQGWSIMWIQF